MGKRRDKEPETPEVEEPELAPAEEPEPTLEQKLADLDDRYHRAVAELANARRRFEREHERAGRLAVARFIERLLPMIDNMDRSLKAAHESHDAADIIEGFGLVESQMLQILSDSGVRAIEAVGKPFDPDVHHAVTTDITEAVEPGTVTEELGRGFTVGELVIRPAQVRVAAAPSKEPAAEAVEPADPEE